MDFIKDIGQDEIRDGVLVTTDIKKAWNKMLVLLVEIDRICQKYSIKYFAEGGTLIGAARHKGFIPWDDDLDLSMLRPDYEKFKQVAARELKEPIILSSAYNSGELLTILKVMDTETAAIENIQVNRPQGIFIDIWPLDDIPDGSEFGQAVWDIRQCLLAAINNPAGTLQEIEKGEVEFKPSNAFIKEFIKLPAVDRFKEYEKFCSNHFGETENVGYPFSKDLGISGNLKRKYYREVIYLPFESLQVPVPVDYERVLEAEFGDWRKLVRARSFHELEYLSTDISYEQIQSEIKHKMKKVEE